VATALIGRRSVLVAVVTAALGASVAVVEWRGTGRLDVPAAVVLGLVEGLTEFLPVSSTGHLTVIARLLDLRSSATDAYAIVIQGGAILAVPFLYHERLRVMGRGLRGADAAGRRIAGAVMVAFVPAAVVGFALGDAVKERLFGVGPVAAAWATGGVVILATAHRLDRCGVPMEAVRWQQAAVIGVAQAGALWPGVSRSLVTIVAGVLIGLSLTAAVEFSFLLGFVTLGSATAFEAARQGGDIVAAFGVIAPLVGFTVAFGAAVLSVRWMVSYVRDASLAVFGVYRLAAAGVALLLLATGLV